MTHALPARPSLARLRDQARALQRACRAGEREALARLVAIFPEATEAPLSKTQAVIAREYGFSSWPRLKADVEAAVARILSDAEVLAERWLGLAEAGDLAALNRSLAVGKGRLEAARDLMRRDPSRYRGFVQAIVGGLASRRARIRFECAHGLDIFGDAASRSHLIPLMEDPVPRVRWMAMHALSCHACGEKPDVMEADVSARIAQAAAGDPSIKVRRHAVIALGLAGDGGAAPLLRQLAQIDADIKVRRNAAWALTQISKPA